MKIGVGLAMFLFGFSVQASLSQQYCSNGEATVRLARGDTRQGLDLTLRTLTEDGQRQAEALSLAADEYRVEVRQEQELFATSSVACEVGDQEALSTWRKVTFQHLKFFRADEAAFDENIVGVSYDRTFVSAPMICEENGESLVDCDDLVR